MTPQEEKELAEAFGFANGIAPYHDREFKETPKGDLSIPFQKALLLVDRLLTVRFYEFIPDFLHVDSTENSEVFLRGHTWCLGIRTDIPPPIAEKDQNWSGVFHDKHPEARSLDNYFRMLTLEMGNLAWQLACYRIAPPLIYATSSPRDRRRARIGGVVPYIGVITKFLRKREDGRNLSDFEAQAASLVPWDSSADPSQRVGGAISVTNDDGALTEIVKHPQNLSTSIKE